MSSIVAEAPGYIQVFSNGTVKRFEPDKASPSPDVFSSGDGYKYKDVIIDHSKPINARLFVPDDVSPMLPLIVYFHGGGFCIGSTAWLGYHCFLGDLAVTSRSIVLSVDYRLAPENRLPTAYEDCYTSVQWLISKNQTIEPWLKKADLSRVFLSGDSAGGNIAHQVALLAIRDKGCGVTIKGLLPIHPYFGSEKRTEKEMEAGSAGEVAMNDMFWGLSLPEGSNRDYWGCNFETAEVAAAEWGRFPAVVVYVAGMDFLKERGVLYGEFLKKKGVRDVKVVEEERESHVYHVFNPLSEATRRLQNQMSDFIHNFNDA